MSSGFVSAGNVELSADREDAWKKAKEQIDSVRKQKEAAAAGSGLQEGGKTLYETLQANKAAKQEAFEESVRQKTQVNFLNEEDEEYLESLSKNERAQKAASAKQAREQLAEFRKQQDEAEKKATAVKQEEVKDENGESWAVGGRKRKKGKEQDFIKGVKLRKTSSPGRESAQTTETSESIAKETGEVAKSVTTPTVTKAAAPAAGLGLGAYSSDEDD